MDSLFAFDDEKQQVRILYPRTPSPWINYLSKGDLHALVSQRGGGFLWWKSPTMFRLTHYRGGQGTVEGPGFNVYLKDGDGSAWSPAYDPLRVELDEFSFSHPPSLSRFEARKGACQAVLELFIIPGENVMVWRLNLTNLSQKKSLGMGDLRKCFNHFGLRFRS